MLRCLVQAYGRAHRERADRAELIDTAIGLMGIVTPVAEALTTLPANAQSPGVNAGMTFATLRGLEPLVEGASEWRILSDRFADLAEGLRHLTSLVPEADALAQRLDTTAARFLARANNPPKAGESAPMTTPAPAPATPSPAIEIAEGEALTIAFEGKRCIHSRQCVLKAPTVFLANTPGAWIMPNAMDAEKLVAVAENCPSGAIQYKRRDGRPDEAAPPVNVLTIRENGPLAVNAPINLDGVEIGMRATLCRCGQSKNKPFCDGSHNGAGFTASGEPPTGDATALAVRNGPLAISPLRN
ncbi:MAG: CDGSH iron-sulfur domain-containing protein, partial [Alphaproteobacteria bacterium]